MASQIVGSSFVNGALLANYVNGRVLAATDLATSQGTLCQRDEWVGQDAGTGIVSGLWVTAAATTLTVANGLGVAPSGEPISLAAPVTLALSLAGAPAATPGATFASCCSTAGAAQSAISDGAYLLTALPACQLQGQSATAPAPGSTTGACTPQWEVEGVQFKAISLPVGQSVDGIDITADNLRNLLAHWCLGTAQLASLGSDPFNFVPTYRGIDQLATSDLTPNDLPLCVFYWGNGAVSFADNWSARRRPVRSGSAPAGPTTSGWPMVVSDQMADDGEARFLQFQDQVLSIVTAGTSRATEASDVFGLLPPVGFLPVALDQTAADLASLYQTSVGSAANDAVAPDDTVGARPALTEEAVEADVAARPAAVVDDIDEAVLYRPTDILSGSVLSQIEAGVSQLGKQSGFVPDTFFGALASFGGFITWDAAYFALRQSYTLDAVPTAASSTSISSASGASTSASTSSTHVASANVSSPAMSARAMRAKAAFVGTFPITFRAPGGVMGLPPSAPPATPPPPALRYYYVTENFIAVLNAIHGASLQVTPYLVFIKNEFWPKGTLPPFQSSVAG